MEKHKQTSVAPRVDRLVARFHKRRSTQPYCVRFRRLIETLSTGESFEVGVIERDRPEFAAAIQSYWDRLRIRAGVTPHGSMDGTGDAPQVIPPFHRIRWSGTTYLYKDELD